MTPLHLQIAIHYHISPEQWPMLHVEIHHRYAEDLRRAGLLKGILCTGRDYKASGGLAVLIEALCSTPVPVQRWVMPDRAQPADTDRPGRQ